MPSNHEMASSAKGWESRKEILVELPPHSYSTIRLGESKSTTHAVDAKYSRDIWSTSLLYTWLSASDALLIF